MTVTLEDRNSIARHCLFILAHERLCKLAHAVTDHRVSAQEFAVVAVNTTEPRWESLIKVLNLKSKPSEQNATPLTTGSISWETVKILGDIMPGMKSAIEKKAPKDTVYAFIFGDGGCSVYSVPTTKQTRETPRNAKNHRH